MILGRISQVFIVHLSTIDWNCKDKIKIMAYGRERERERERERAVNAGDRIAQLLLLPYIKDKAGPMERRRGFVSTGKMCVLAKVVNDHKTKIKTASEWCGYRRFGRRS